MGTKITLYNVSIEGHEDVMAFLGEQDANTFSRIIFAGKDQYRISRSQVEADQIMEGYSWAVSNDSGDIPFDIVFFKEDRMRNIFVLTLIFAMAGMSIDSFDLAEAKRRLDEVGKQIDTTMNSGQIPLSWIQKQSAELKENMVMA
jgi:hypothetical protein